MTYWEKVRQAAAKLHSDGCTASPDLWIKDCCYEHDIAYRTGKDVDGVPISRLRADWRLLRCIQSKSPLAKVWLGAFSPLSWVYFAAVRIAGIARDKQ